MSAIDNTTNRYGQLAGPKSAEAWRKWRQARDKAITAPRRLKTCKDDEKSEPSDTSTPEES